MNIFIYTHIYTSMDTHLYICRSPVFFLDVYFGTIFFQHLRKSPACNISASLMWLGQRLFCVKNNGIAEVMNFFMRYQHE
eukprot:NODE_2987_length_718_cov_166.508221_g2108_i0.p4 GENE.NODE_2987_length_718_cov_166.508221_g2108_i0~~NODE_2987_length_718_cov_166.508221_g2108_i0.p4  ORF type:complete len:80 (-),score=5.35 NODE_2987_length_718_cov_166.508221_g2108_i0:219-458(-)